MKTVVEKNIPFARGLLEPFGEVVYAASDDITPELVKDADALLVRTRTRCDEKLLRDSRCSFVGTATIGLDHIDLPWCEAHGITIANAPGCNAPAVAQYVFASILRLANRPVSQYTIGIVGVGHVGSIVERWARLLGMDVMVCDPPRQLREGGDGWSTLAEIAGKSDIITFHTPLDHTTRHMAGNDFFASLRRAPIIINAARGPVIDTSALVKALDTGMAQHAVIDCWEGEPHIPAPLLERASIATPHIAGYSREGKIRATRMVLDAYSRHFGLGEIKMEENIPAGEPAKVSANTIMDSYDPMTDDAALRANPGAFEALRNGYALRPEVR